MTIAHIICIATIPNGDIQVAVGSEGLWRKFAAALEMDSDEERFATNRERVDLMLAILSHFARKMDSVRRAFAGETDENADANGDSNAWLPEFIQARRALKHALLIRTDAPASEQRRIAAILARATAENLSKAML